MAPDRLIPTLQALSDGLTYLRFLMPELITEKVIVSAFDTLAGSGAPDGRRPRQP
jgi:hypothetical protein